MLEEIDETLRALFTNDGSDGTAAVALFPRIDGKLKVFGQGSQVPRDVVFDFSVVEQERPVSAKDGATEVVELQVETGQVVTDTDGVADGVEGVGPVTVLVVEDRALSHVKVGEPDELENTANTVGIDDTVRKEKGDGQQVSGRQFGVVPPKSKILTSPHPNEESNPSP